MPQLCYKGADGQWHPLGLLLKGKDGLTMSVNGVEQADGNITLTAADIPVSATDETDVQTALIQRDRVRNLLDNSDFTNAVNQRGQTSWSQDGIYCIDQWKTDSASNAASITLSSGGIVLTPTATLYAGIYQKFDAYSDMAGKVYTLAVCVGGFWDCVSLVIGSDTSGKTLASGLTAYSTTWGHVLIRNKAGNGAITIEKAALYKGSYTADTLPAYVPKGYAAELLACQRYYTEGTAKLGWVFSSESAPTAYLCDITYPVPMRVNPTVTIKNIKLWSAQSPASITAAKNIGDNHGFNSLNLSGSANGAVIQFDYAASADL